MNAKQSLDSMITGVIGSNGNDFQFKTADAQWLCRSVKQVLMDEKTVLDLSGPINVVGDVHGQLSDLVRCLQLGGLPPFSKWLFLGDYVDRGPKSVEVICLLFALKIRYPTQIYLIRGNHESPEMTEVFGFALECTKKLTAQTWTIFCDTFEYLPIAAIINGKYFCIHGGISPQLEKVQQIRNMKRPLQIAMNGLLTDLLWSDPNPELSEFGVSTRGTTCNWGLAPAKRFLQNNNLKYIIRGHQVAVNGYDFPFNPEKCIITMFSASNYSPEINNKAAFMFIDQVGTYEIKVLTSMHSSANISHLPIAPRMRKTASARRLTLPLGEADDTGPVPSTPRPQQRRSSTSIDTLVVAPAPRTPRRVNAAFRHSYNGKISRF